MYTTEASLHASCAPLSVDMSARTISAGFYQKEAWVLVTPLTFSPFVTRLDTSDSPSDPLAPKTTLNFSILINKFLIYESRFI